MTIGKSCKIQVSVVNRTSHVTMFKIIQKHIYQMINTPTGACDEYICTYMSDIIYAYYIHKYKNMYIIYINIYRYHISVWIVSIFCYKHHLIKLKAANKTTIQLQKILIKNGIQKKKIIQCNA